MKKAANPQKSLSNKLVRGQLANIFGLILVLDIMAIVAVFGLILFSAGNRAAAQYAPLAAAVESGQQLQLPEGPDFTTSVQPLSDEGMPLFFVGELPENTRFYLAFPQNGQAWLHQLDALKMHIQIPYNNSAIAFVMDLSGPLSLFFKAMGWIGCMELLLLCKSFFDARRLARQAMQPIQTLTHTARQFNAPPPPNASAPDVAKAVHTLNAIDEAKLDIRISIDDASPELQGLASAINAMLARLDAAYRSQTRFVSDASHELRTPIAVIQGYANLLDRWGKEDPQTLQESISAIKIEADHMKELVEQLLFLARSDSQTVILHKEAINLSALLEAVVSETRMIDPNHQISGSVQGDLSTFADEPLLKQAIRIFMDNSIKYSPADTEIKLSAWAEDKKAMISITDQGIGIPEEALPHVFDRFFRTDESRTRETGGTGLGLSIAKWIIDAHGGQLTVLSREGIGTRFSLTLPTV